MMRFLSVYVFKSKNLFDRYYNKKFNFFKTIWRCNYNVVILHVK